MRIKIISGIYGLNEGGRVKPKTSYDEPFEVDDAEAERLISLGAAKKVASSVENPANDEDVSSKAENEADESEANGEVAELETPEEVEDSRPSYSDKSDIQELRDIAKAYGVSFSPNMGKAKLLKKLDEFFDEQNSVPDLSAGDPVI